MKRGGEGDMRPKMHFLLAEKDPFSSAHFALSICDNITVIIVLWEAKVSPFFPEFNSQPWTPLVLGRGQRKRFRRLWSPKTPFPVKKFFRRRFYIAFFGTYFLSPFFRGRKRRHRGGGGKGGGGGGEDVWHPPSAWDEIGILRFPSSCMLPFLEKYIRMRGSRIHIFLVEARPSYSPQNVKIWDARTDTKKAHNVFFLFPRTFLCGKLRNCNPKKIIMPAHTLFWRTKNKKCDLLKKETLFPRYWMRGMNRKKTMKTFRPLAWG